MEESRFCKGHVPWNKGKKLSAKHRRALRLSHLNYSDEIKTAMSKRMMGMFTKEKHPNWKGGTYRSKFGRVLVLYQNYRYRRGCGYIFRSRLVMMKYLGRKLLSTEIVHHINGIKDDDRLENLMLCSRAEHMKLHDIEGYRKYDR